MWYSRWYTETLYRQSGILNQLDQYTHALISANITAKFGTVDCDFYIYAAVLNDRFPQYVFFALTVDGLDIVSPVLAVVCGPPASFPQVSSEAGPLKLVSIDTKLIQLLRNHIHLLSFGTCE